MTKICRKLLPLAALCGLAHGADKLTQADVEFFETKVRPVLAKNCYGCHSSETKSPMAGLFLDSRAGVRTGGRSGPAIVPGKPEDSLLIQAIEYQGRKMPPSGQLSESAIADLTRWVAMGAPDPREPNAAAPASSIDLEKGRKYWAFQPPQKPAVPKVKNPKWSAQPVDRFLLAAMEKQRIAPVTDAPRSTWLRRVTLDLTGLPPTPSEIDAFQKDASRTAYSKVVDRLLASPQFGERWSRHWLDVARYADSVGRGRNYAFPFAWRYRDWVIDAFNSDLPYDQFVRQQVAGDLLPSENAAQHNRQLIATGFLSLGSHDLVEQNPTVFRMDVIDEQINATSRAFMGVTVGCARCHDHKFDPIPTTDYYAMAGIFKSTDMLSGLQRRPRDNASYFSSTLLARLSHDETAPAPEYLPDPKERAEYDALQAQLWDLQQNPRRAVAKIMAGTPGMQQGQGQAQQKLRQYSADILRKLDQFPLAPDLTMAVRDSESPTDTEVLIKGEIKDVGPMVPRGFPQVMSPAGEAAKIDATHSGRLELAQWLTRRDNPTTARVAVNRIWEHLFGVGIVPSVDNFGKMGEQPSNQALLDYLAVRFMDQGWSTKKLIREIVLSRAYRLSTATVARNEKVDPDNKLLWRANRRRLEVEAIRDSLLMVAGRLDLNRPAASPVLSYSRAAPVVRRAPRQQEDYAVSTTTRSIYVPVIRNMLPEMFETFDFPEPSETKGVRDVTTVPTQALFLMNSRFVIEQARAAASRLLGEGQNTPEQRVTRAYLEVLNRAPSAAELNRALVFLHSAQEEAESAAPAMSNTLLPRQQRRPAAARRAPGETPLPPVLPEISAWEHLYQALFASAEFRYRG